MLKRPTGQIRLGRVGCWSTALPDHTGKPRASRDSRLTVDSTPSIRQRIRLSLPPCRSVRSIPGDCVSLQPTG
ncbi:hypothetical protein D7Y61_14725 [Stenotrophomonas maltophilia]|nr:hypothetical protein [Stenotrophomonas maltophilia]